MEGDFNLEKAYGLLLTAFWCWFCRFLCFLRTKWEFLQRLSIPCSRQRKPCTKRFGYSLHPQTQNLGPKIPFFPLFKSPRTPLSTIFMCHDVSQAGKSMLETSRSNGGENPFASIYECRHNQQKRTTNVGTITDPETVPFKEVAPEQQSSTETTDRFSSVLPPTNNLTLVPGKKGDRINHQPTRTSLSQSCSSPFCDNEARQNPSQSCSSPFYDNKERQKPLSHVAVVSGKTKHRPQIYH